MSTYNKISDCRLIELETHSHANGTIAVAQNNDYIPFAIKRVFYIYDIPTDTERGAHSHIDGEQLIVAASGSFDIEAFDGENIATFTLNRPYRALYVPSGIWISLKNFTSGCVCLTLCSNTYDESDYVRSIDQFMHLKNERY